MEVIGHLTNYGQKAYFWIFWIFSHGGMSRWAVEISGFRLTRHPADYLKIENFRFKKLFFLKIELLNLKNVFYS
jgi:hypothetical protein